MGNSPKKQFILAGPAPLQDGPYITFEGHEWSDLEQASQYVALEDRYKFAVEIKGRCFLLDYQETLKIMQAGIPFRLGFDHEFNLVTLPCNGHVPDSNFNWLKVMEYETKNQCIVIERVGSEKVILDEESDCSLEIVESSQILTLLEEDKAQGICQWKKGKIGDYKYEVKLLSQPSKYGLFDKNIAYLLMRPQCCPNNPVLAEFRFGDRDVLIPCDDNDLLMRAIAKLVDYYAPKAEST